MHGLDDYSEKLHSLLVLNKLHLTVIWLDVSSVRKIFLISHDRHWNIAF